MKKYLIVSCVILLGCVGCNSKENKDVSEEEVSEVVVTPAAVTETVSGVPTEAEEETGSTTEEYSENVTVAEESDNNDESENPPAEESSSDSSPPAETASLPAPEPEPEPEVPTPTLKIPLGSVLTPYVNEADVSSVNEAYTMVAENAPWGFYHPGVDFMITKESIPVQAAFGGTVSNLETQLSSGIMGWHTGFCIEYGENGVCYNLETFSVDPAIGERQRAGMLIANGQAVTAGQPIGSLIYGGSGAHIDFGITSPGTRVCPEPYFNETARASVLRLIHQSQPSWQMCY